VCDTGPEYKLTKLLSSGQDTLRILLPDVRIWRQQRLCLVTQEWPSTIYIF